MSNEELKNRVFKRLYNSVPKGIWVLCASYMAIILSTVAALLIARIDADKHINKYLEIQLAKEEMKLSSEPSKEIKKLNEEVELLKQEIDRLKLLAHEPGRN